MIEGQLRQIVHVKPGRLGRIVAALNRWGVTRHPGHVDDRDGMTARVASRRTVRAKLTEKQIAEAGFLGDFPLDGCGEVFTVLHETTRQGPTATERIGTASDQEHRN